MVEQLECPAVLDMKWSGARLAVATAKGSLHIYAYREGCGPVSAWIRIQMADPDPDPGGQK